MVSDIKIVVHLDFPENVKPANKKCKDFENPDKLSDSSNISCRDTKSKKSSSEVHFRLPITPPLFYASLLQVYYKQGSFRKWRVASEVKQDNWYEGKK